MLTCHDAQEISRTSVEQQVGVLLIKIIRSPGYMTEANTPNEFTTDLLVD